MTGTKFKLTYSASGPPGSAVKLTPIDPDYVTSKFSDNQGQSQINHAGTGAVLPSEVGNVAEASYLGSSQPYYIDKGKIVTVLAGTPIEVTAYKLGDKIYGARSNEFGYVNYEIIPQVVEINPLPGPAVLR